MESLNHILERIAPALAAYQLRVAECTGYVLQLQAPAIVLRIVYHPLEYSYSLSLGGTGQRQIAIDNDTLRDFFHSPLALSQVSRTVFTDNLLLFLQGEARLLLDGDPARLAALERFDLDRSRTYTAALLLRQNKAALDQAWAEQDYARFTSIAAETDMSSLPASYVLKYKIAQTKNKS